VIFITPHHSGIVDLKDGPQSGLMPGEVTYASILDFNAKSKKVKVVLSLY
jgi:hypothetical protein